MCAKSLSLVTSIWRMAASVRVGTPGITSGELSVEVEAKGRQLDDHIVKTTKTKTQMHANNIRNNFRLTNG